MIFLRISKKMILIKLLVLIMISGCLDSGSVEEKLVNLPTDEKLFKKNAIQLSEIIRTFYEIEIGMDISDFHELAGENALAGTIKFSEGEREAFIHENINVLQEIDRRLVYIVENYSDYEWADDAMFCRTILAVFLNTGGIYSEENLKVIKDFLNYYSDFIIEPWTQETFSIIFRFIYLVPSDVVFSTSLRNLIKGRYYLIIISQAYLEGDYLKADNWLEKLKRENFDNDYFLQSAKKIIEVYQSIEPDYNGNRNQQN